jgi:outer membrane beta-barrel protein
MRTPVPALPQFAVAPAFGPGLAAGGRPAAGRALPALTAGRIAALVGTLLLLAFPAARADEPQAAGDQVVQPASDQAPQPANDQVIQPQVDRRDVKVPHIPSNDIELGLFTGAYNAEHFGNHLVEGARLGYHVTESIFIEGVYGRTKVSDAIFRLFLPGGVFPLQEETLQYYDLSAGYNIFPGEIFLAKGHAKVSTVYLIGGLGTTKFDGASHETINAGLGMRVFMADWAAIQFDMRDHFFTIDLLGTKESTQNLEFTVGLTFFF